MVDAIAAGGFGAASSMLARSGLDAEIARYKKQLADCVNCPSTSSSPEGKALIQELSGKIKADQGRVRELETSAAAEPSGPQAVPPPEQTPAYDASGAATTFSDGAMGSRLNLFA